MSSGNPYTKDPYIVPNTSVDYKSNDWFYMNPSQCKLKSDGTYTDSYGNSTTEFCKDNRIKVSQLKTTTNELDASRTQYNDAKLLYNRELLFTVNMLAGLALLGYYIYKNKSMFPSPEKLAEGAKTAASSMKTMVASKMGNMQPPVPN